VVDLQEAIWARITWRPWLALSFALLAAVAAVIAGTGTGVLPWAIDALTQHWWRALAIGALYTVPGLALLGLLWPRDLVLPAAARLALAMPVSAALPPLLLLLFETVGLPWGRITTWLFLFASLAILFGGGYRTWSLRRSAFSVQRSAFSVQRSAFSVLVALTTAALLVRLYIVRDLPTGLLGDSYHHTMMAQLLVDNGGLFRSWQPYAPLETFTYHFGFHANAAFVHWLTGVPLTTSVLWAGQIMNTLAVPAAFALAVIALRGSAWTGVLAALVTGFVLTIPAHYVVWGRYTQLTGQVVLVAVVVCWARLAERVCVDREPRTEDREPRTENRGVHAAGSWFLVLGSWSILPWRLILLTALMTAAMLLTHYLVSVFAALFVGSYLVALVLVRARWPLVGRLVVVGALAGGLALLLAAPWLVNLASGYLVRNATAFTSGTVEPARVAAYSALPQSTPLYAKSYVLLAAFMGLLTALWRRDWRMALPGVWCALLVLCVTPQVLGIPGAGAIDNLTALSALYLPLAPLAGYALASLGALVQQLPLFAAARMGDITRVVAMPAAAVSAAVVAALLVVVAWGSAWQTRLIDGSTQLVAPADVQALDWLRRNTPSDALILVNGFPAYGGTLVAGTDAGWWIPLLAGRQTTLPPLTYGSERGPSPDYGLQIGRFYQALRGRTLSDGRPIQVDITNEAAIELLRRAGVTHVYSGASVSPGPQHADRIDTTVLRASPAFRLVYEQGGVEIYQMVIPEA
jgi:hypothetical protein